MEDFTSAAVDLEPVVARDPKYDYQRAAGLRAHALARIGDPQWPAGPVELARAALVSRDVRALRAARVRVREAGQPGNGREDS